MAVLFQQAPSELTWATPNKGIKMSIDFEAIRVPTSEQEAKESAQLLLEATDYSVLSDVDLLNKDEFVAYRANLRAIMAAPQMPVFFAPIPKPIWPTKPE